MKPRLIAHRGNINGPNPEMENHPEHIRTALQLGFDVEIDVRHVGGMILLGHDSSQHKVEWPLLEDRRIWCHAKTIITFQTLLSNRRINCFYLNTEEIVLTSQGYIWTFGIEAVPNTIYGGNSGCMSNMPSVYGICSDYVQTIQSTSD